LLQDRACPTWSTAGENLGGVAVLKKLWASVVEFLAEAKAELRKVSFPTKAETIGSTTVVIIFCVLMSIYLSVVDSFLVWLVGKII
jgi:preprotein translocase subunit SecE